LRDLLKDLIDVLSGRARNKIVKSKLNILFLFRGNVQLTAWEPSQAPVFLKKKKISKVINDGKGGMKYIFPLRGEEFWRLISLRERLLTWEAQNVHSRESIPVNIRLDLSWKVSDAGKYATALDRGSHSTQREAIEKKLQILAETTLRALAAQHNVTFLISSEAASYLPSSEELERTVSNDARAKVSNPDSIQHTLKKELHEKAKEYGIDILSTDIRTVTYQGPPRSGQ